MGTFSRLRYVIAANVNALIEKAEDPEKLLRALIREMEDAGEEARLASAEMIAEKMHLERLATQLSDEAALWQSRAENAVRERRDDLARAALKAHGEVTDQHQGVQRELGEIGERMAQLERDVQTLKVKMSEAKLKLKSTYARTPAGKSVHAGAKSVPSPSEKRVQQALSRFDRLQTQVENLEARVRSYEVGGTSPRVWTDDSVPTDPAIEDDLQRLKDRMGLAGEQDRAEGAA